jgi:hypothetical protein
MTYILGLGKEYYNNRPRSKNGAAGREKACPSKDGGVFLVLVTRWICAKRTGGAGRAWSDQHSNSSSTRRGGLRNDLPINLLLDPGWENTAEPGF